MKNTDKADKERSIKIVERKVDTSLGTITYTVQVDNDIFRYKTKEEIADMIESQLRYATIKYVTNDISTTQEAFKRMKKEKK